MVAVAMVEVVEVVEEGASRNDERRKEATTRKEKERKRDRKNERERGESERETRVRERETEHSWIRGRIGERPLVR